MKLQTLIAALFLTGVQSAGAQAVNLDSLAHVAFRVSDLDKTKRFYARLGFQSPFQFTDDGKVTESFIKINDEQYIELYPRKDDSQKLGLTHVCFGTADIGSVRLAYIQRGLNPPEAQKGRAGNVLFSLHDPEGQLVEYSQYMPDSLHSQDRGKHEGGRIATQVHKVTEVVKDPAGERAFYSTKLGLEESRNSAVLHVPGNGGEELEFKSGESHARLTFVVEDLKRAQKALKLRGFAPHAEHGVVLVNDPDGNEIAFATKR
jgi:catechol 2,3-dioxygenase-like lactoylglutathione lyase family enzyme